MSSVSTINQQHLVKGCIRNERRAQETLYKQFYQSMAILCMRYTKNQEDANEVVQNSFLKVFQNISHYDESKSSLYTWIRTITVRCAIDFLRKRKNINVTVALDDDCSHAVEAKVLLTMSAEQVLMLVRKLADTTQAVFNLYVMEGYNHREIGEMLKMSEGTSKWHLSEARKQLIKLLHAQERA